MQDAEPESMSADKEPDQRKGPKNRRKDAGDRRNEDRLTEEFVPRRNPEEVDRRKEDNAKR